MTNIINSIRNLNKGFLLDNFKLDSTDKRVKVLKRIERQIKKDYNIATQVVYVDIKHKVLFNKDSIAGTYISSKDMAIVYVSKGYKANVTTLCHELTHGYQAAHKAIKYNKSVKDLKAGITTYSTAWHEKDAKQNATQMYNYYTANNKLVA